MRELPGGSAGASESSWEAVSVPESASPEPAVASARESAEESVARESACVSVESAEVSASPEQAYASAQGSQTRFGSESPPDDRGARARRPPRDGPVESPKLSRTPFSLGPISVRLVRPQYKRPDSSKTGRNAQRTKRIVHEERKLTPKRRSNASNKLVSGLP